MNAAIQIILNFFKPVIIFYSSCTALLAFLLGALQNPQGLMNTIICSGIDFIASIFPSTPDALKIGSIINSISSSMPAVGRAVIADVFNSILAMVAIVIIIKIYKLLPFKMS